MIYTTLVRTILSFASFPLCFLDIWVGYNLYVGISVNIVYRFLFHLHLIYLILKYSLWINRLLSSILLTIFWLFFLMAIIKFISMYTNIRIFRRIYSKWRYFKILLFNRRVNKAIFRLLLQ